jgi:transposase
MSDKGVLFGVDVAKASLTIGRHDRSLTQQIDNRLEAIVSWLRSLPAGAMIGMEATGGYHELLASVAQAQGFSVYVLNPQALLHYAKGMGRRGKTDPVDARLIARYIAHEHTELHRWAPARPGLTALAQLLSRRARLVQVKQLLAQSFSALPSLDKPMTALRKALKKSLARLELLIVKSLAKQPALRALHARLQSLPGVGPIVGAQLCLALSRLAFRSSDAFIAYSGLDPRPDDSGQHRGRRRLSKQGSAPLRRLLYLAAMAASCKNQVFAPLYRQLRARGFHSTEAYCIIARKIARFAFALFKSNQEFDPQRLLKTA